MPSPVDVLDAVYVGGQEMLHWQGNIWNKQIQDAKEGNLIEFWKYPGETEVQTDRQEMWRLRKKHWLDLIWPEKQESALKRQGQEDLEGLVASRFRGISCL